MNANIAALLYLASGVLFILALRGLSSPATSQAGARNGMIGMAIAIGTTLWVANVLDGLTWGLIAAGLAKHPQAARRVKRPNPYGRSPRRRPRWRRSARRGPRSRRAASWPCRRAGGRSSARPP